MVSCLKCKYLKIEYRDKDIVLGKCMNPPQDLRLSQESGSYAYIKDYNFHYDYGQSMNCPNFINKDNL